ncbi:MULTISPECIES: M48 family metallopeptidase [Deinococcus]|uniref:M48 family metallopeptidase n=1 Tax=Deinococcus rufus TaxID=2136097 RepID=A0ABV7Z6L6_9DEIO|nr:M48 family metallopeptidase [Deinococcus sp. AB2017081]WQE94714.1 M48 family metallopeptidase [Deinococcus sp. AB2017081]
MMNTPGSLRRRMVIAVLLMIGFYVLVFVLAGALIALPIAEVWYLHRIHPQLALGCVIGAVVILLAAFPRSPRFEVPGPRLEPRDHPRLFAELEGLARASGQAMPSEVYLLGDLNAWVTEQGGRFRPGRRIIGVGLPLMQLLNVDEFRAVLAHEFGHYAGGDTRLGQVVFRTRASLERTVGALREGDSKLSLPFQWYATAFLRITQAISRRQEFAADHFAAQHVGSDAMAGGLVKVHGHAMPYAMYWQSEAVPVLRSGFRPPLASGYQRFQDAPDVRTSLAQVHAQDAEEQSDPYASHPSLHDRLGALGGQPPFTTNDPRLTLTGPSAETLLSDPDRAERALLTFMTGTDAPALQDVAWEHVGTRVIVPAWREMTAPHHDALGRWTLRELPDLISLGAPFGKLLNALNVPYDQRGQALAIVSAALGLRLHDAGWDIHSLPGEPITLTSAGRRVRVHDLIQGLVGGGAAAEDSRYQLEQTGLIDQPLAGPVTAFTAG